MPTCWSPFVADLLLRWVHVTIARLDPAAIEAAGDYDSTKRRVKDARPFGARGPKTEGRRELADIMVRAQVEVINLNKLNQGPAGNVPDYRTMFVVHYRDLERNGLVDTVTGRPAINNNDRIVRMQTRYGKVLRVFEDPQVFITETRDGNGWLGYDRNLLLLITNDRPKGVETAG